MADNTLLIGFLGDVAEVINVAKFSECKAQLRGMKSSGDGKGFDRVAIWKRHGGECASYDFAKAARRAAIMESQSTPATAPEPPDPEDEDIDDLEIESLRELATGDKRKVEVKDAIARLAELGIDP